MPTTDYKNRAKAAATKKANDDRIAAKVRGRGTDIPLDNIPDKRRAHSPEFKKQVADRVIAGEKAEDIAKEFNVVRSLVSSWVKRVRQGLPLTKHGGARSGAGGKMDKTTDNVAAVLRHSLERAVKARDERLEAAASIVEADAGGREGAELAKKIRAFIRKAPT